MKFWPLFLFLPLLAGCGEKTPPADVQDNAPRLVKALKVGAGGTAQEIRYSGEVRARHETALAFRVGGKLVARHVDAGARVAAGTVLARLDPADLQLAAAQAEAQGALATAELRRAQELRQKNFVSQAALEAKETAARAAQAQAQLAQHQAGYATLVADAPGSVAAVLAEPGQVVAAGQPVLRLARDGEREIAVAVPEMHLAAVKVGAGGTARLWVADGERSYRAVLRELAPAADPATRTFAARIALPDAPADLPLGLTATVSFAAPASAPVVVPLAALMQQGEQAIVWVIGTDQTLSARPVDIESFSDAGAVLRGGLAPGETIVAAGAFKLVAGERVRLAPAARP